jgi:hypothetical protein
LTERHSWRSHGYSNPEGVVVIRRLAIRAARFIVALAQEPVHPTERRPARSWREIWAPNGTIITSDPDAGIYRPAPGERVRVHTGFVVDEAN